MSHTKPRGRLMIGLGVATGAFAAAAMMSAAGTPAARADSFTDIVNAVQADIATGQVYLDAAATDFASSNVPGGVAALVGAADNDFVSTSENILAGSVALLTNETVPGQVSIGILDPGTFANALADVQEDIADSQTFAGEAATALAGGDYAAFTLDSFLASDLGTLLAGEDLFLGALDTLGI